MGSPTPSGQKCDNCGLVADAGQPMLPFHQWTLCASCHELLSKTPSARPLLAEGPDPEPAPPETVASHGQSVEPEPPPSLDDLESQLATVERVLGDNLASRWQRLGGALVDVVVIVAIVLPIYAATGIIGGSAGTTMDTFEAKIVLFLFGQCLFLMLNGYTLYSRGQTIGKIACGTRIVDGQGCVPSFGAVYLIRHLVPTFVGLIPVLGGFIAFFDILPIFGSRKRCIHDYLAGTWVVNASGPNSFKKPPSPPHMGQGQTARR